MSITRYDLLGDEMQEAEDGVYVQFADHEAVVNRWIADCPRWVALFDKARADGERLAVAAREMRTVVQSAMAKAVALGYGDDLIAAAKALGMPDGLGVRVNEALKPFEEADDEAKTQ